MYARRPLAKATRDKVVRAFTDQREQLEATLPGQSAGNRYRLYFKPGVSGMAYADYSGWPWKLNWLTYNKMNGTGEHQIPAYGGEVPIEESTAQETTRTFRDINGDLVSLTFQEIWGSQQVGPLMKEDVESAMTHAEVLLDSVSVDTPHEFVYGKHAWELDMRRRNGDNSLVGVTIVASLHVLRMA